MEQMNNIKLDINKKFGGNLNGCNTIIVFAPDLRQERKEKLIKINNIRHDKI